MHRCTNCVRAAKDAKQRQANAEASDEEGEDEEQQPGKIVCFRYAYASFFLLNWSLLVLCAPALRRFYSFFLLTAHLCTATNVHRLRQARPVSTARLGAVHVPCAADGSFRCRCPGSQADATNGRREDLAQRVSEDYAAAAPRGVPHPYAAVLQQACRLEDSSPGVLAVHSCLVSESCGLPILHL